MTRNNGHFNRGFVQRELGHVSRQALLVVLINQAVQRPVSVTAERALRQLSIVVLYVRET